MGKGQYNRYITCEKCGTEYYTGHHTCPQCGFERQLSGPTKRRMGIITANTNEIVECEVCQRKVGKNGIGSHMSRMHGMSGVGKATPGAVSHRIKTRGDWTVSLVNGKKQIAATVSDTVAKRIIGMLF
jgi:hypothetical protein